MAEFLTRELSSARLPAAWDADAFRNQAGIFSFDLHDAEDGLELLVRPEQAAHAHLEALGFAIDGETATPTQITAIPRGSRISFSQRGAETLTVTSSEAELVLPVQPSDVDLFAGRNVIFTLTSEPEPGSLCDWLAYHARYQDAQAALLFIRARPGFDLAALRLECRDGARKIEGLERLVWVELDVAIGHPEMPAEASRHLAPNAPGKANLPAPEPDPWRAPITEVAILEVGRRRFLSKASAVLYCQPSDLIQTPAGSAHVFERARAASGFLKFRGHRAYPFALKEGDAPKHGDHCCVSFDGGSAENIWCAAPARLEPNAFWRQFRVTNTDIADAGDGLTYWRCMSIRHPALKVSEIVPKSSLIEAPALLELVGDAFDAAPRTPPKAQTAPARTLANDKILVVTTMKNEGPFILEWLAYHRAIGVTDFLVYTNDCTDGTDEMFDLLQAKGFLEHRENPFRSMDMPPQHAAFQNAETSELAQSADWIICMDVDEFINIHVGDGTLNALFQAVPDATMFALTWRLFGNADVAAFEDRPIIEQFDQCAHVLARKPHQAWGFKTLFRNLGHYKKFGVHRPKGLKPEYLEQIKWVNGSGAEMPDKILRSGWRSSIRTIGYDLVSLNHYALRSAESFLVKRDRGRVNHVDRDQGLAYWFRMNHNAERETSIQTKFELFRAELARLKADPELLAMHLRCVRAHTERIEELRAAPEYAALYDEITGERLRALSRMLHNFGNQVFLDGPDAVPPDFHLRRG